LNQKPNMILASKAVVERETSYMASKVRRPAADVEGRTAGRNSRYQPLDRGSASDEAYGKIVDLILTRDLRPGERTSVNLLANRLGLGKTPIKEAITRLQTEGVLTVVGRSGTTVKNINVEEARQLFALRRVLEEFAADEVVKNITPSDISSLQRLLKELKATSQDQSDIIRSSANFIRANVAFHSIIVSAAANPFLSRLYSQLQIQAQIVTYLVHRGYDPKAARRRQAEHEEIVAALEERNARQLKRALRTHAETSENVILQSLESRTEAPKRSQSGYRALGA
jgi:DNA-binding GntR family transcriptional regulator